MFKSKKKVSRLEEVLPIIAIENDYLLSKNAEFTACYELHLPEVFSLSEGDYERLFSVWVRALSLLPDLIVVHKQDIFMSKRYEVDFSAKEYSYFDKAFQRHFLERPYQDHKCYLFITKSSEKVFKTPSMYSLLTECRLLPYSSIDPRGMLEFADKLLQFEAVIKENGLMDIRRLRGDELIGKDFGNEYSPIRKGIIEEYLTLYQDVALGDIYLDGECLRVGGYLVDVHSISDIEYLPRHVTSSVENDMFSVGNRKLHLSFLSPIGLLLPCNHIVNQYIFLEQTSKIVTQMEKRVRQLISLSGFAKSNEKSAESLLEFLDAQAEDSMRLCRSHINVISMSENKEQRLQQNAIVAAAFAKCNVTPYHNTLGAANLFWAGIPGAGTSVPKEETFICFLTNACCLMTLETNYTDSVSPFGIKLCERLSGRPVHVDISDEPMKKGIINNRNKFVVGPSGSGKSFFMNHMLRQYYEQGAHIVMVDVGHSYERLCEIINIKTKGEDGYYFTYDEDSPLSFNPFYTDDGEFTLDKKNSILTLLFTLWRGDSEEVTKTEMSVMRDGLEAYIEHLYSNRSIAPSFNSFYEFMDNEYRSVLSDPKLPVEYYDFDLDNFLITTKPYYGNGHLGYLLNSEENIDFLTKRFVVFEIDKIKDDKELLPIITIIIMEMFINKMRRLPEGVRKVIVIEEAWSALANSNMAGFIAYLYRTVRKFYGEAMVVTQNISDLVGNPVVKDTIVNNSDCKIVLDMGKFADHFDEIAHLLGLNEKQQAQVLSINAVKDTGKNRNPHKEVYILLGEATGAVYATEVSRTEYYAYTTESKEKEKVNRELQKVGGNLDRALFNIVSEEEEENNRSSRY